MKPTEVPDDLTALILEAAVDACVDMGSWEARRLLAAVLPAHKTGDRTPESGCELTSYRELASLLESLPMLLREARRSRRLSTRAAADEIGGIGHSTLWRVESGRGEASLTNAVAVLRWLDRQGDTHG